MAGRFRVQKWRRPYHRREDPHQPVRTSRSKSANARCSSAGAAKRLHAALKALECALGAAEV
jgi:hypothetical protein